MSQVGEKESPPDSVQGETIASFLLDSDSTGVSSEEKITECSTSASKPSEPGMADSSKQQPPQKAATPSQIASATVNRTARVSTFINSKDAAQSLGDSMTTGSTRRLGTPASAELEHQIDDLMIRYGTSSFQGLRDYQEDTVAILKTENNFAAAVFDGHGGDQVSKELERVLLQNIQQQLAAIPGHSESISSNGPGPNTNEIQDAISATYTRTNHEMGTRIDSVMEAGSCAVTCLISKAAGALHLFCANAGDCRAVLYSGPSGGKKAVRLSQDHKPQAHVSPSEIARVCNAGGCVLWGRVQGCLAVSRAFGDKTLEPYVIADPHVVAHPINPDQDSFIYLVSDGVTDLIEDEVGCAIVQEQFAQGNTAAQAAAALVNTAYKRGSSDNISAVVIRICTNTSDAN